MKRRSFIVFCTLCAAGVSRADSNRAFVVKDIETGVASSSPKGITRVNGIAYFFARTDEFGVEVWRSDGTTEGTQLIKDINSGAADSVNGVSDPVGFRDRIYFPAESLEDYSELWVSDGTEEGTFMLKDLQPGRAGSNPRTLGVVGETLFFVANYAEIWKTDGTEAGTVLVKRLNASLVQAMTDLGGVAHFAAKIDGDYYPDLWRSDGTEAGTHRLKDFGPEGGIRYARFVATDDALFFRADDGIHGSELWASDGTPEGTLMLQDIWPGPDSGFYGEMAAFAGKLYFTARSPDEGTELWVSDGTPEGTRILIDLSPGRGSANPSEYKVFEGALYFGAFNGLWKTDGSAEGTVFVKDVAVDVALDASSTLNFLSDNRRELWKSDGTESGTVLVAELPDQASSQESVVILDSLLFIVDENEHGKELWISDGTQLGTELLRDIRPGNQGSSPETLVMVDQTLFFGASAMGSGTELWKSDGSEQGTVKVKEIRPGRWIGMWNSSGAALNGEFIFNAYDGVRDQGLWRSDGTEEGTVQFHEFVPPRSGFSNVGIIGDGDYVYFYPRGNGYRELWRSDGTAEGTVLITELTTQYRTPVDGSLFFTARDELGEEIWVSDVLGTRRVKDIWPGPDGSIPMGHTGERHALDGVLYTVADDPVHDGELWRSDGTEAGTYMVVDIYPGLFSSSPRSFADMGGLLFFGAYDPQHGSELWISDGTAKGTRLLVDSLPGPQGIQPQRATGTERLVFFTAEDDAHGRELWVSDGTAEGTRMVKDIRPGPEGSNLRDQGSELDSVRFVTVNDVVFFVADDGVNIERLWRSDGTAAGTVPVATDGARPLSPEHLTPAEDRLYFVAAGQDKGRELWALDVGTDTYVCGDVNCDGAFNAFDIEPFLLALFDPENYLIRFPDCDINLADTNGDGKINAFDIEAFLALLFP